MTTYKFPPEDKTLYGLTTGTVYKPEEDRFPLWKPEEDRFPLWKASGTPFSFNGIARAEPDGVTDVRPFKVGDVISTVEELEALPDETVLLDKTGAWVKSAGLFLTTGDEGEFTSSELADDDTPFTIMWLPETGEQA